MSDSSLPPEVEARLEELAAETRPVELLAETQPLSLLAACAAFDYLRDELFRLFLDVREGKTEFAKKLAPSITELGRALGTMLREYDKVEEHRGRYGAKVQEPPLDLGEARDEIGRRMARLRTAGTAGEISEGADGK